MDEPVKRCTKCGVIQPITEFTRDAGQASGLRPSCKTCQRQYREANRETITESRRQYYEANAEARREASRRYHAAHYDKAKREAKSKYDRQYRETNHEEINTAKRRRSKASREAGLEAARKREQRWRETHRESTREAGRRHREANREAVLTHYSPTLPPSCACCGTTSGHLGIDHIGGDGKKQRKEVQGSFWRWLIKQGFPPGYQVLCQSCNSSKGRGDRCRLKH